MLRVVSALKAAVAATCVYETAAICTGRAPTVSALCRRHKPLGPIVLTALAADFYGPAVRQRLQTRRQPT